MGSITPLPKGLCPILTLEGIFQLDHQLITHCEDEQTIRTNLEKAMQQYGEDIPMSMHPIIRSEEACYLSSSTAVELAKKYNSRLHVFHISTAKETELFTNKIPLAEKRITAEVCVHHLWFDDSQYESKGSHIKWNPAVKQASDREGLWKALLDGRLDVVATDHAPHTLEEKSYKYLNAPSGGPLVQHALPAMMERVHDGVWDIQTMVEKMCHNPAILFRMEDRGYIREGYHADLVLLEPNRPWKVSKDNILYKCQWSPFEGTVFKSKVTHTFVNGHLAFKEGNFDDSQLGERLLFNRD